MCKISQHFVGVTLRICLSISDLVYPVTPAVRIEQDIKPQLVAGPSQEGLALVPGQPTKKLPKHLEPVVSLVQLNLEGLGEGSFESGDDDNVNDDVQDIDIKQEIDSDSSPSENHGIEGMGKRSRKRKTFHDYEDEYEEEEEEEYTPIKTPKRKATPKRVNATKANKISPKVKSPRKSPAKATSSAADGTQNDNEQLEEKQNITEDGAGNEDGAKKAEGTPKPKKK